RGRRSRIRSARSRRPARGRARCPPSPRDGSGHCARLPNAPIRISGFGSSRCFLEGARGSIIRLLSYAERHLVRAGSMETSSVGTTRIAQSRTRVPASDGSQAMTNTMSYRGYVASMIFDAEDKVIVGRVLDVEDIITFHGESVADFEANFHMVVDDYIAACESLGGAPEK